MRRLATKNRKRKQDSSDSEREDAEGASRVSPDLENGDDDTDPGGEDTKTSVKSKKGRKRAETGARSVRNTDRNANNDTPPPKRKRVQAQAQENSETDESAEDGKTGSTEDKSESTKKKRQPVKSKKRKQSSSESEAEDADGRVTPDQKKSDEDGEVAVEESKVSAKSKKGRKKAETTGSRSARNSERGANSRRKQAQEGSESDDSAKAEVKSESTTDEQFEVQEIVGMKTMKGKQMYQVRWVGYRPSSDTWEYEEDLQCPDKVKEFKAKSEGKKKAAVKQSSKNDESNKKEEFEVQEIIDMKLKKGKPIYRVRWVGYGPSSDTWEYEEDLQCPDKMKDFKAKSDDKKEATEDSKTDVSVTKEEYEVEKVIEVSFKKNGKREFLIRWKGFTAKDDTWEPEENLNCPDLIEKFMGKLKVIKDLTQRELRTNPKQTDYLSLSLAQGRHSRRLQQHPKRSYCGDFN